MNGHGLGYYVAGSSREIDRVKRVMYAIREAGHHITHDWTANIEAESLPDAQLSNLDRMKYANRDLLGIMRADVFVLLVPEEPSTGAWVELGFALGRRTLVRIAIVGNARRSLFTSMTHEHHHSDESFMESL